MTELYKAFIVMCVI